MPLTVFAFTSLFHTLVERFVENWRVKLLRGAGQETRRRSLLIKFVIERKGKGHTVVTMALILLAEFGS